MELLEVVSSLAAPLQQVAAAASLQVNVVEVVSSPAVGVLSADSMLSLAPSRMLAAAGGAFFGIGFGSRT